jgi:hypothetical protein
MKGSKAQQTMNTGRTKTAVTQPPKIKWLENAQHQAIERIIKNLKPIKRNQPSTVNAKTPSIKS